MKTISNELLQYLLSTDVESTYYADLFTVQLVSGQVLRMTNGQLDIQYGGNTFYASKYGGWECTTVSCELGCLNATANIRVYANADVLLPDFDIPLMQGIQEGLFDAAVITILTTYGFNYGETDLGTVIRYSGQCTDLQQTGRTTAQGTIKPYTFTLNQPMPRQVIQTGCRWTLFDADTCTVNKAVFSYANVVGAGTSNVYIVPASPIVTPSGITLEQGVITFISGRNTGLSMSVQAWDGTSIRLTRPFLFPVQLGDEFTVTAGCAHTAEACFAFQGSSAYTNYGGQLYVPSYESAL